MAELFTRQAEAWDFVRSIPDPTVRLLTEIALGNALAFLASDPVHANERAVGPLDALTYARAVHAFLKNKERLSDILSGKITAVDDLDPFSERPR